MMSAFGVVHEMSKAFTSSAKDFTSSAVKEAKKGRLKRLDEAQTAGKKFKVQNPSGRPDESFSRPVLPGKRRKAWMQGYNS